MATTIYVTGKIVPIGVAFTLPRVKKTMKARGRAFEISLSIKRGLIAICVQVTEGDIDSYELCFYALEFAQAILDSYGFAHGAALSVDLHVALLSEGDQILLPHGFSELATESLKPEQLCDAALSSSSFRRALADYRLAIQSPRNTFFYSFRALESLRQHFHRVLRTDNKTDAWEKMRKDLRVNERFLRAYQQHANIERHGDVVPIIRNADRLKCLERTRDVLLRYADYILEGRTPLEKDRYSMLDLSDA